MEFIFIIILVLFNSFFAMSEIAIIASRKSRLFQLVKEGRSGAKTALVLAQNPDKFFPTIQIGITLISILAGAIGEATLATRFAKYLEKLTFLGDLSGPISFLIIIGGITFISLVIGELVPKHVAINNPEKIAVLTAPFMGLILKLSLPIVRLLSFSSNLILNILGVKRNKVSSVTDDEIRQLMSEGTRAGIFNAIEKRLVDRVLLLDHLQVGSLMTRRESVQWFDIVKPAKDFDVFLTTHNHSRIIICKETLDNLVGVIHVKDFISSYVKGAKNDLETHVRKPHFVSENTPALKVLELFRKSPMHLAIVIDQNKIKGLVTFNDVLEAVVGKIQEKKWMENG